ncbi:unnamed protein product [Blepharisma stoltei]|uniref:Uncharacterized protein n=1 Tax=Blepharisma stoltei TaxID=1481888 RepID=A0AAU9J5A1_9CILI|nr:unnamed protein product [Blepharisma stoltei]
MSHVLKDFTNLPLQKPSGPRVSEATYRKPIFKAKRLIESGVTTRAVSLSSARDLEECLENSVKNSPFQNDPFASGSESPHICSTAQSSQSSIIESSVKKNLDFDEKGLQECFSLLMTPVFGKRSREETISRVGKKSKEEVKTIDNMQIELLDPDLMASEYFRCYKESDVISDLDVRDNVIKNECDDDCPTDDAQIEVCISYLAAQIEQAILSEV